MCSWPTTSCPVPVYFDGSSGTGHDVAHWSVYGGGTWPERPRAAVLRAVCACGWAGASHTVDWAGFGDLPFREAGTEDTDRRMNDWDGHMADVTRRTIPAAAEQWPDPWFEPWEPAAPAG